MSTSGRRRRPCTAAPVDHAGQRRHVGPDPRRPAAAPRPRPARPPGPPSPRTPPVPHRVDGRAVGHALAPAAAEQDEVPGAAPGHPAGDLQPEPARPAGDRGTCGPARNAATRGGSARTRSSRHVEDDLAAVRRPGHELEGVRQLRDGKRGDLGRPQLAALEQPPTMSVRIRRCRSGLCGREPVHVDHEERDVLAEPFQAELAVAVDVGLAEFDEPAERGEALEALRR